MSSFSGGSLVAGPNDRIVTVAFTATQDLTCVVTSSTQISTTSAASGQGPFVRNLIQRNPAAPVDDNGYAHYIVGNGLVGDQNDISRTSQFSVSAGQSVAFGARIAGVGGNYVGAAAAIATQYSCA